MGSGIQTHETEVNMPYQTIAQLPDAVKKLPTQAQDIYMSAFNSASKDNKEGASHAIAWTAVEKSYEKNESGKWVAKEADLGALSDENKRSMLQNALTDKYHLKQDTTIPSGVWVEEVYESELIYSINGQDYKVGFELTEGVVTFGEPEKVIRQVVYKPMEALQTVFSEVIQEAGKRNASMDSARVKKILEICQELLSSELEPDKLSIKRATKEAADTLAYLKTLGAALVEDGATYPASAFAYTPDVDDSNTWKLRLKEGSNLSRFHVDMAAAYFSPGGYKGQKVAILEEAIPEVKRKIREAYRALDVQSNDIPKWVKSEESRELLLNYMPLTEAKFDKGRATVIVIKPGFNASEDRYYPAEMLKRDYGIFEGMKMYADHPTEEEDAARPERSIKDWVATLSSVVVDEAGIVTGVAEIVEPWLMTKLASLREKGMLSEMGISINAVGVASKETIDGKPTLVIEKLTAARSVDFVTEPGAGGVVTLYEADRGHDIDLIDVATLKENRPDLVKTIETEYRAIMSKEVKSIMESEARITELEGQNATLTTENTELRTAAQEADKAKAIADAQAIIKEAVEKAELPPVAKAKLLERYKDSDTSEGITEAIQAEVDYIASITESGKVRGLGPSQENKVDGAKALKESIQRAHPEYTEAQLEIAVNGN